ncbi:hypothetical protein [Candidatus Soleaferrea massiliensis]|uniref:hypothetical protein n=1 Tax=Candidatus Soleaferrea massiliensis TaxID=1470354 RepID=UPI000590380E|nr:hypothetical protein [Candidatus Soleaferrea massiliensis]
MRHRSWQSYISEKEQDLTVRSCSFSLLVTHIIYEMLAESGKLVTQSKVIHDDLEKYDTQNTDFDKVAAKIQETTDKVRKIILASDEAASR